jgi:peroxiredoxin
VDFGSRPTHDIVVPWFSDAELTRLVTKLDAALVGAKAPSAWGADAPFTLWGFARQLQTERLTSAQETRVLQHLDTIARTHPESADSVVGARHMVSKLTIGKTAPEITGLDLDGKPLKLSDYRGKVVLLVFSGEWCGICRSQYPYERLLLELYKNWPFAIVGVESGTRESANALHADQGLAFRAWWDGGAGTHASGTIASSWNVLGWPAAYLIDARGVIRFVDLRDEDLLKGVRQLLTEQDTTPAMSRK